jgi:hypothetical protein
MCKTLKDGRAPGAIDRLPGERWADFDARQRAHRIANTPTPKPKRKRAPRREAETYESRLDNLGESPDY